MSHISENRTVISNVHEGLLQEALELIAQVEPGITITQTIKDYGMNDIKVDLAIFNKKLRRGLGLNWKGKNGLVFTGDSWDADAEFQRMQKLILLTYQTLGVQKSLTMMGYQVETQQPNANTVRLEAVHA